MILDQWRRRRGGEGGDSSPPEETLIRLTCSPPPPASPPAGHLTAPAGAQHSRPLHTGDNHCTVCLYWVLIQQLAHCSISEEMRFEFSTMENNFISRSMTTTSYHDVTKSSVKTFVFEINIKRWLIDPLGAQSVIKATRLNHLHLCLYFQADVVWVSQMFREIPKLVIFIWRVKVLLSLYCIL